MMKMSANLFKINGAGILAVAILLWSISGFSTSAYAQGCCGGGQHGSGHAGHGGSSPTAPQPGIPGGGHAGHGDLPLGGSPDTFPHNGHAGNSEPMPHGGQLVCKPPHLFEVVYQPQEIRVYIYGPWPQPRSAKEITGEVSLQPYKDKHTTRVELRYVAAPAGEQDYLSATADLSGAEEKKLMATIKLNNLPVANHSTAEFSRAVVVTEPKPKVTLAELDKSDQAGIARQQVCPVTGAKLGSMGDPIKMLVDGKPLYLCCQGCVAKVKNAPETYLAKVGQSHQSQ
jgi:YHS domain-containing protein